MIAQFQIIGQVKKLREDKALRELDAARKALEKAQARTEALTAEVEESARTLPAREQAIYDVILTKIVGMSDVDDAKAQVQRLLEDHQKLIDKRDRAREHVVRCEKLVTEARAELVKRQGEVEKIETLTYDLIQEAAAEAVAAEEAEIEDLFARPSVGPDIEPVGVS